MTIDLSNIKATRNVRPPRIMFYGPEKIGKSGLLAQDPNAIFFPLEHGNDYVTAARWPEEISTYSQFMDGVRSLAEQQHNFRSAVIDTADRLEELINAQAAAEHGKKTVQDVDYGKGFATQENIWRDTLNAFDYLRNEKGMAIFLICHAAIKRYDNPITGSYDRYNICLHENTKGGGSADIVKHWVDSTMFINYEVFKKSEEAGFKKKINTAHGGERFIYVSETPSFVAGNRWGLTDAIPYKDEASAWNLLNEALTTAMTN